MDTDTTGPDRPLGYGRYGDDPEWVGCPRARTSETPCVARDASTAVDDDGRGVGCGANPAALLTELVAAVTKRGAPPTPSPPSGNRDAARVEAYNRGQIAAHWITTAAINGVTILALNEYQRLNLLWALEHIMRTPGDAMPNLNTGDWVGEIRWMIDGHESVDGVRPNHPWRDDVNPG
jgi:GNAT superfamily N-acetyltransferase